MLAMPRTIVRKMTGVMIIFTRFMNVSPTGLIALAVSGDTRPSSDAQAIATRTWTVRFW